MPRGRPKGAKNKRTIEREAEAALELERERLLQEARAQQAGKEIREAVASGKKLMKEIAFEFAEMFASLAAFYQPALGRVVDESGQPIVDEYGRPKVAPTNPNFNEQRFLEYGKLATITALQAAVFQSPKLGAVLVKGEMVTEIEVIGGLPDEEDGGLYAAETEQSEPGPGGAGDTGADATPGEGGDPAVPSEPSGAVPAPGQAQGGPLRKAVG